MVAHTNATSTLACRFRAMVGIEAALADLKQKDFLEEKDENKDRESG